MPTDNVVPIDAESARQLEQSRHRFRCFVALLATVWLLALGCAVAFTPLPPLVPFLVLAALVVLAEHRFVLFGDETSMSASIIVIVASIFIFAESSPLAGPMLVASFGGCYLPLLRDKRHDVVLANVCTFGLAALPAAGSVMLLGATSESALLASSLYWVTNSAITGVASAVRNRTTPRVSVTVQLRSEAPVLFLVAATAMALASQAASSPFRIAVAVGAALAAFEAGLRASMRVKARAQGSARYACAVLVATAAIFAAPSMRPALVALTAFVVATTVSATGGRVSSSISSVMLAFGSVGIAQASGVGRWVQALTALYVYIHAEALQNAVLSFWSNRARLSWLALLGLAIPSRRRVLSLAALASLIAALDASPRGFAVAGALIAVLVIVTRAPWHPLVRN